MFRRMRNAKGEAIVQEPPVVAVGGTAREVPEIKVPEKPAPEKSGELAAARLKLNGNRAQVHGELDGDAKRRRRLLNLRVDLHRKLLEVLNLSAIERCSGAATEWRVRRGKGMERSCEWWVVSSGW